MLNSVSFWLSILGLFIMIFDLGYSQPTYLQIDIYYFYVFILIIGIINTYIRNQDRLKVRPWKVVVFDKFSVVFIAVTIILYVLSLIHFTDDHTLRSTIMMKSAIVLTFIRELSNQNINYKRRIFNPAQLLVFSFLLLIMAGTALLLLPNATFEGISFTDALFTSTSAVCVTGLIVVDTGTYFTQFGQAILLLLIQLGGLGILTFASYFSYFFKGGTSFENQIVLSELTSSQKIGDVFKVLKRIIGITVAIELVGALLIYVCLDNQILPTFYERFFFSAFHSISAFCNAGFSTLSSGLYDPQYRFNYLLQIFIMMLFVMGGLGFPIVINILKYCRYMIKAKLLRIGRANAEYKPWVMNLNSRITLITTGCLIVVGTMLIYISEYHHTLAEHHSMGKVITAMFEATTPRTAGFNTVDMTQLQFPTLMLIMLLMWIGASPASTGGGIKTSTFAVSLLNIVSLARGKSRIEVYRRKIADITIRRASATISLSFLVIGIGIFLISVFDSDMDLMSVSFECFSAFSTVGLSIGITSQLSLASKIVLIAIMFAGRVTMLTILIALIKKEKFMNYQYPVEEITIN